ncbi:hypothetical protein [Planctomonas deserti]|uniref:hypothetical protein n=1 Tax=Planctomonas deserti TaxID=2144185 RepID=UPI000D384F0C|nr:hypothetical protein [Planctomonas deserti]
MIRLVPPLPSGDASHDDAPPAAYAVPWEFDRSLGPPLFTLTNVGSEVLHAISLHLLGSGAMLCRAPITMRPGDSARIILRHEDDLALNTVLVVRWFRPDGGEYLWRVSF